MKKSGRYAVLAIVLGLSACLDTCRDKKTDESTAAAADGGTAAAGSLMLAAKQQGAFLPPDLADPRYADESTLPMGPFQLPATDFSKAGTETEPNNTQATATPLGLGFAIQGQNSPGDYDHYVFETTGEAQLWAIEAVGKSVGSLSYQTAASDGTAGHFSHRAEAQQVDSGRLVIPNLYLAAGKHFIEEQPARSASGPYTLRAVPLGQPDLRMEREPNNANAFAHALREGIARVGLLLDRNDRDTYSFALREPAHVLLQVTSPPDITLLVEVTRASVLGGPRTFTARSKGESMRMDAMLPPGDYLVAVRSGDKGSLTPYKLRFDELDPFSPPPDREPNDDHTEAAPIPPDLVLRGSVGEYSDRDWYRLPTLSSETSMRVQVLGMTGDMKPRGSIYVANRTGDRNEYLNWAKPDSMLEMRLPPNAPLFIQIGGKGDYQLRLSFNPGLPPIAGKAPFTVSVPPGPFLVEAFSTLAQRQPLPVTVHNPGKERIQLALEAVVSHNAWSVTPQRQMVTVDPGKQIQVPLELNLPPDAGAGDAVQVAVRASSSAGSASATTRVYPLCGAAPVNAQTYAPLPGQMLGGLNLAATALGAHPVATDINKLDREKLLYDGITPNDAAWTGDRTPSVPDLMPVVALAGDRPASITGVTLIPGNGNMAEQVDQFDVLVSEDGQAFRQVMSGRLRLAPIEQAFTFAQPVRARFAQLRVRSNQLGGPTTRSVLGEWKVIAAPGEHPFPTAGFNLADPTLGGHVVWSQPLFAWPSDAVLTEAADGSAMRLDPAKPPEWVIGFRHNRAAQIARLEWVQPAAVARGNKMIGKVEVSVSTDSPIGPWTPIGSWKTATEPGSTTPLNLTQPVWARFVRFSTTDPRKATENWRVAEHIRIYERASDSTYRSVLAEWGHYARPAIYERMVVALAAPNAEEVTGNGKRDDAKKLESGKAYRGRVMVEEDEDWYRIEMPRDHNRLSLTLQGDPMLRAVAYLQDESGKNIAVKTGPAVGGIAHVDATMEGGKTYFLKLVEPPRSIALVWDNSASVIPFSPTLYRALGRFVESVQPRREFVNFLPFRDDPNGKFLLTRWSDQPYVLQGAIQSYDRRDGSSNAELALLAATKEMENIEGSKAILFLTDAASGGYDKSGEVWAALGRVPARVFAVELHIGSAQKQQQLMQDWADANGGHYSTFRTSEDIDTAFDRTSCYLRRPAHYTLTVETRFEVPPAPAGIENALAKSGRVDVYGIYFDHNSAKIKPESEPVLKEISDALTNNPAWKLRVEGHTDNVGGDAPNMGLSRARSASVKQALVTRYGIAGDRLATAGFGASRPKESNRKAEGRAKNRRVELVRQ